MRGSPPDIVDDAANRLYHRKPIHRAIVEGSRIELHSKNSIPNFSSRVAADSRELSSISYSAPTIVGQRRRVGIAAIVCATNEHAGG